MDDLVKYEKIITINDERKETLSTSALLLINCMYETGEKNGDYPQFFRMSFTNSEKNPFAKDMKLEWASCKKR